MSSSLKTVVWAKRIRIEDSVHTVKLSVPLYKYPAFTVCTESLILFRFARNAVFRVLLINHPVVLGRGLSWPKLAEHEHHQLFTVHSTNEWSVMRQVSLFKADT